MRDRDRHWLKESERETFIKILYIFFCTGKNTEIPIIPVILILYRHDGIPVIAGIPVNRGPVRTVLQYLRKARVKEIEQHIHIHYI